MRARTMLCALLFTEVGLLTFTGCSSSNPANPTPPPTPAIHNQWTWQGGPNIPYQAGIYGTQGTPAPTNIPGAREDAISWTDASGDFWLFGGYGNDYSVTDPGVIEIGPYQNDLWKYSAGQWTWMGGSALSDTAGVYGTLSTAAPGNNPGARSSSAHWLDTSGTLWLFGGQTYTATAHLIDLSGHNHLNDLWKYSAGQWTWMGGSNVGDQTGTYGTLGTPASTNIPSGRFHAASWTDSSGNFWLFGGDGLDATGTPSYLNDLWRYSAGQWTWMGGSTLGLQPGVYGTQGVASPANVPGGREQSFSWTDAAGTFWVFGGNGYDSQGTDGFLNDLWKYSAGQWTWVGGSNLANQPAVYGTQGTAASGNIPGARNSGVSWIDASGSLWLFGGGGYASPGHFDYLNDVWKYSAGQWTWIGGPNSVDQVGTYGTEGTPASGNIPGGRFHAASWLDSSGSLWLFGGNTQDPDPTLNAVGVEDYRNDLWEYRP
jgi:hypothetical protein